MIFNSRLRPLFACLCTLALSGTAAVVATAPQAAAQSQPAVASAEKLIVASLSGPNRTQTERARDRYRHPLETLTFFGLRPEMTVIELWPGQGWYTAILAPVLAERGQLVVTSFDPNGPLGRGARNLSARLAADPATFGKVKVATVNPPDDFNFGPANSADMVLTFRNIHNWAEEGYEDKVYAAAFKVLKKGGILGVEEHRAKAGAPAAVSMRFGYMPEDYVIKKIEAAGFKLVGRSEVNANPSDTKDYPGGVWTLPPTLSQGDKDRDRYLAIGESDRMTLKFVKP